MTVGSCFSGILGLDQGFDRAGFKTLWRIEWDSYCQKVIKTYDPDCLLLKDIKEVDPLNLNYVDVVIGGFPCCDISLNGGKLASGKKTLDGEQSSLFTYMSNIIDVIKPKMYLIENVTSLKRYWEPIINAGYFSGYNWEIQTFKASDFGDYTRRKRTFVVGYSGEKYTGEILGFPKSVGPIFSSGGREDVLPMCLPWKGGVNLERLGSCFVTSKKTSSY